MKAQSEEGLVYGPVSNFSFSTPCIPESADEVVLRIPSPKRIGKGKRLESSSPPACQESDSQVSPGSPSRKDWLKLLSLRYPNSDKRDAGVANQRSSAPNNEPASPAKPPGEEKVKPNDTKAAETKPESRMVPLEKDQTEPLGELHKSGLPGAGSETYEIPRHLARTVWASFFGINENHVKEHRRLLLRFWETNSSQIWTKWDHPQNLNPRIFGQIVDDVKRNDGTALETRTFRKALALCYHSETTLPYLQGFLHLWDRITGAQPDREATNPEGAVQTVSMGFAEQSLTYLSLLRQLHPLGTATPARGGQWFLMPSPVLRKAMEASLSLPPIPDDLGIPTMDVWVASHIEDGLSRLGVSDDTWSWLMLQLLVQAKGLCATLSSLAGLFLVTLFKLYFLEERRRMLSAEAIAEEAICSAVKEVSSFRDIGAFERASERMLSRSSTPLKDQQVVSLCLSTFDLAVLLLQPLKMERDQLIKPFKRR